jgi:hypothetical protein
MMMRWTGHAALIGGKKEYKQGFGGKARRTEANRKT